MREVTQEQYRVARTHTLLGRVVRVQELDAATFPGGNGLPAGRGYSWRCKATREILAIEIQTADGWRYFLDESVPARTRAEHDAFVADEIERTKAEMVAYTLATRRDRLAPAPPPATDFERRMREMEAARLRRVTREGRNARAYERPKLAGE